MRNSESLSSALSPVPRVMLCDWLMLNSFCVQWLVPAVLHVIIVLSAPKGDGTNMTTRANWVCTALVLVAAAAQSGCGGNADEPYKPQPTWSGKKASLPAP